MFTAEDVLDTSKGLPAGVLAEVLDLWKINDASNGAYILFDTANEDDAAAWPVLAEYLLEWDYPRVLVYHSW